MTGQQIRYYESAGKRPLIDWLETLKDRQARARIKTRIDRLALGNFGDHRALDGGIYELRIHWGPGYRVYFARVGPLLLLLLCGGDKTTQQPDIEYAKTFLKDYQAQAAQPPRGQRPVR